MIAELGNRDITNEFGCCLAREPMSCDKKFKSLNQRHENKRRCAHQHN